MMNKSSRFLSLLIFFMVSSSALLAEPAHALDQIIKPFESVRSAGMGGVTLTTGLYEENYFGNPARVTENPSWRVTILDPSIEANSNVGHSIKAIDGGNDIYSKLGSEAGQNNHFRLETTMPSVYIPPARDGHWGFALGLITSSQVDIDLRRSFSINPTGVIDIGPAFTAGTRLLEDNALSVGATAHVSYRLSTNQDFTLVNLIGGQSLSPKASGGQGGMIDFDVGFNYALKHYHPADINFSAGASVDNVLGGQFNNLKLQFLKDSNGNPTPSTKPIAEPRRLGLGVAAQKDWIAVFQNTVAALEFQDIGNNPDGSLFRTVHLGAETHLTLFVLRFGINQGYVCGGVGIDLKLITIDLSSYGEEMSLNPGGFEDRRYAIRVALQI